MNSSAPQLNHAAAPVAAGPAKIYGVVLTVGVMCALAIAAVYELTRPVVQRNRIAATQRAILQVLPQAQSSLPFAWDEATQTLTFASPDTPSSAVVFAGFNADGQLVGVAIETRGMGYQDVIRLLYGYSFDEQAIIGIRVLESRETPGLGDRVEKDAAFLDNFRSLDVRLNNNGDAMEHPIAFVPPGEKTAAWQIDGISGATISSRAIADMLGTSTATWIPRVHPRRDDLAMPRRESAP